MLNSFGVELVRRLAQRVEIRSTLVADIAAITAARQLGLLPRDPSITGSIRLDLITEVLEGNFP